MVTLVIGLIAGAWLFSKKGGNISREEQSEIIVEKINEVNKLISLEGSFAEVYTLDQTQKLFFDLIPIAKQAIVIAKAKTYVAYDLSEMTYDLNEEKKSVHLKNIPEPEIIVDPKLEFYDLKFNIIPFNKKELSMLNERATELIREEAQKEEFINLAKKNLELNLQEIILVANQYGWEVMIDSPESIES